MVEIQKNEPAKHSALDAFIVVLRGKNIFKITTAWEDLALVKFAVAILKFDLTKIVLDRLYY